VIAFYLEDQHAVDEYVAEYQADLDQLRTAGSHAPSIVELRRRLMTRQPSETLNVQ
jgi:hypothetical protein